MLPFFGQVKTWMITAADIIAERPGPPPSTSSSQMAQEVALVKTTLQNLTRAQLAIATKWADGASSPTPPGHWNFIAEPYITNANFSEVRAARAFALLDMAMHDSAVACWDTKYFYFTPRPEQMDPTIKTVIGLPNFPSYDSGHSSYSGAASVVLSYLFPSGTTYFNAEAQEAAISRLYGGIHYQVDNDTGPRPWRARRRLHAAICTAEDGADQPAVSAPAGGQTLDGASFHSPVAPGSIAAVFQTSLAATTNVASSVPLPTSLNGGSLSFNGSIPVPLFAAAPNQANIQIPWEYSQGLSSAVLTATGANGSSTTFSVPLSAIAPAIFSANQQGTGQGVTVDHRRTPVRWWLRREV